MAVTIKVQKKEEERPLVVIDCQSGRVEVHSQRCSHCAELKEMIRKLRRVIIEHHSSAVMRPEHTLCPACEREDISRILDAAALLSNE